MHAPAMRTAGPSFLEPLLFDSRVLSLAIAALYGVVCYAFALRRHRSAVGWALTGALGGYFLQALALPVPLWLYRLPKVDLRKRYLELKATERILELMGGATLESIPLEERILMVLANNPEGLYLNALAQGVGQSWRAIAGPVEELVHAGKVHLRDERYFIDSLESVEG